MSHERIPKSNHETVFWIAVGILTVIMLLFLMQSALGIW